MIYTAIAAGALGLILALLGTTISLKRISGRGTGEDFERLRRVHANGTEHIPILLILILCAEALAAPKWVLQVAVGVTILARVIHAAGYLIRRRHPLHTTGATLTYILESGLAVLVLVLAIQKI